MPVRSEPILMAPLFHRGFRDGLMYPKLVQCMLDRHHSPQMIERVLGLNFEASFSVLRPGWYTETVFRSE